MLSATQMLWPHLTNFQSNRFKVSVAVLVREAAPGVVVVCKMALAVPCNGQRDVAFCVLCSGDVAD